MSGGSQVQSTFAIIGVGLIGPRHAQAVLRNPDAKLIAVVDPTTSGEVLAGQLGVKSYKSAADLITSPYRPDAAIICTPNHTHVAIATELTDAGIDVLIEKPFCTDPSQGQALVNALATSSTKALVGHHRRFNSYIVAAKRILESGELGEVIAINGLWALYKPPEYFLPPTEWRTMGTGGVILINMIHEIDILHHLFGPIIKVHAEKTVSHRGHVAEEGAAMVLRFSSGMVGTFLITDAAPSPHNFESGTGENPMIPTTNQDFLRIFGRDGSLSVPDMSLWTYSGTQKSWTTDMALRRILVEPGVPFEDQLSHFIRVIRRQAEPLCTVGAGQAAVVVCSAIKEALEKNGTVHLPPYQL